MNPFLVGVLIAIPLVIIVTLYRVWRGPSVFDRLVGVALVSVNAVVVLVVVGFALGRPVLFLDIALGVALLAFLLPIALGKYVERAEDVDTAGDPEGARDPEAAGDAAVSESPGASEVSDVTDASDLEGDR